MKERERTKERVSKENPTTTTRACAGERGGVICGSLTLRARAMRPHAIAWANRFGYEPAKVDEWLRFMDESQWQYGNGRTIDYRNFQRSLRMFYRVDDEVKARRQIRERERVAKDNREREAAAKKKRDAEAARKLAEAEKPETWALCQERCAHAKEGCGCVRGWKVPPDRRSWPVPPEQCPNFKAKE